MPKSSITAEKTDVDNRSKKSSLGQFFTPATVSRFMAAMFSPTRSDECSLLDPGYGIGSLTSAFLDRWDTYFHRIRVTGYEVDDFIYRRALEIAAEMRAEAKVLNTDFIYTAVRSILSPEQQLFSHAIINPPYKKINAGSRHRYLLRKVGIETVNLYTAFVALSVALLIDGGQLVAIIPRSFCNGPYYRPFRNFIMERAAIRHIHLFHARDKAFRHDAVLQENVIVHLVRGGKQGDVTVSTSTDDGFNDYSENTYPFSTIVLPEDPEGFIHVPYAPVVDQIRSSSVINSSLEDLGIQISTGPVVDFRLRQYVRQAPEPGTVPLLYACHLSSGWPKIDGKKPNAIQRTKETERWLYPNCRYVVTKRFSSKEERRRVVATVVDPGMFPDGTEVVGFENHLNVFHTSKSGLSREMAAGLAAYLNSTAVDDHFRKFSGHTQVNATDLRNMKYPGNDALMSLGRWAARCDNLNQDDIDQRVSKLIG